MRQTIGDSIPQRRDNMAHRVPADAVASPGRGRWHEGCEFNG